MSDTSKRRARKSKLVPRDYGENEDVENNKLQTSLTNTPKIFIASLDNLMEPGMLESSIKFNVQIEVESCDEEENLVIDESYSNDRADNNKNEVMEDDETDWAIEEISKTCEDESILADTITENDEGESILSETICENDESESLMEYMKFLTALSGSVLKITEDEIIKATDEIMNTSDNIADKILSVEVKNILGRHRHIPNGLDKHEILIQEALESWVKWFYSKSNDPPLFYKCYICKMGWWHLSEFRDHIRDHDVATLNVDIEALLEQCCIVAYSEKPAGNTHFLIKSDCWRCGKDFNNHTAANYECSGCMLLFKTCLSLVEHESYCMSYWYINNQEHQGQGNVNQCTICAKRTFFNNDLLMKHMVEYHSVRSDRYTIAKTANCMKCDDKYVLFVTHTCRSRSGRMFCENCDRRFCSKLLYDNHVNLNTKKVRCKICNLLLEKQCMEAGHMLTHTSSFKRMFRCSLCSENTLITGVNNRAIRDHLKSVHRLKKMDSRVRDFDTVYIPAVFVLQLKEPDPYLTIGQQKKRRLTKSVKTRPIILRNNSTQEENHEPNVNDRVSSVRKSNSVTHNIVKYTAIHKTSADVIKIAKVFSDFTEHLEDKEDGATKSNENSEMATYNNSDNVNNVCKNKIMDENISNTVIKKEIIDDKLIIDDNSQEISNVSNDNEIVEEHSEIKKEIADDDNLDEANELTNTTPNTYSGVNKETLCGGIRIKEEVLDVEEHDDNETLNYDIKIEASDSSLSKVFRVSDHLKKIPIRLNIKEEFNEEVLTNAQFEDMGVEEESSMFEPEVILHSKKPLNIYYCGCCDFKGTHAEFKEHEYYCDDPNMKTYNVRSVKIYTCISCDFKGTHSEFRDHRDRCDNPQKIKPYDSHYCSKCKKDFASMRHYLIHLPTHGIPKKCCPVCGVKSNQYMSLNNHIYSHHIRSFYVTMKLINKDCDTSKLKMYQCQLCRAKCKFPELFRHWEKHLEFKDASSASKKPKTNKHPVRSDSVYDNKMLAPDALKSALDFLQTKKQGSISKICLICDRYFDRKNDVKRHVVEHLLSDAYLNKHKHGALTCQICGDMFRGPAQYKSHMRDHGDLPVYKCELCDKCFSDSSNFTKHKKVHNISVFVCDLCKKKFQVKKTLIAHMKLHNLTGPLTCTLCKNVKVFYDNSTYRRHMRNNHRPGALRYRCQICKEGFNSLKNKWDHMWLVHKERKNVSDCPICSESFRRYIDVKTHMKLSHINEWSQYNMSFRSLFQMNNGVAKILKNSCVRVSDRREETLVVYE